jgi:anti-anti-sigma regulatory factor
VRHGQEAHVEHDAELLPSEFSQVDARYVDARDAATETVIPLEGELHIRSSDWFGACVGTVLEKHPASIAIDSGGLTSMDSSGPR